MESGSHIFYTKTLEEQTSVHLSISPPNLSMMLVWNNLADPHLSFFRFCPLFSDIDSEEPLSVTFKNPATEAKIRISFKFAPKDLFGELFSKIIFKSSSEFLFWQKLVKFEIGLNVPVAQLKLCKLVHCQNSHYSGHKLGL